MGFECSTRIYLRNSMVIEQSKKSPGRCRTYWKKKGNFFIRYSYGNNLFNVFLLYSKIPLSCRLIKSVLAILPKKPIGG